MKVGKLNRCMFCGKKFKNWEAAGVVGKKAICDECSTELADTIMHAFWDLWDEGFDRKLRGEENWRYKNEKKENNNSGGFEQRRRKNNSELLKLAKRIWSRI